MKENAQNIYEKNKKKQNRRDICMQISKIHHLSKYLILKFKFYEQISLQFKQ